ncbi:hypothetical protein BLS_003341 [Venturia inaequalis]|uniref:Uncharacterized protein n=1 Tax=Venturia inaequalis TaxID=5025 RepID=A0A8H3UR12_VENIN|nr:hypothetical protein BLS_003341 [Venturia inaequalis]
MTNLPKPRQAKPSVSEESKQRAEHQPDSPVDQHHDNTTTTFLSLPREIRQKILVQTFNSVASRIKVPVVPRGPITNSQHAEIEKQEKRYGVRLMWIRAERKKVKTWAHTLSSLHPHIAGDMPYILEGWQKEIQVRLAEFEEMYRQFRKAFEWVLKVADPVPAPAPNPALA